MNALKIGDLTVKIPIIQGGMGVAVSLAGLASAVANEGGVGVISAAGIGMREPDYNRNFLEANLTGLRKEIRKAKSLTNGVIGVNIMMALSDHENLIRVSIEEKADIIILGAGLPLRIPKMIAESGLSNHHTKLIIKVSSAKAARLIFQYWAKNYNYVPDAVVVEGPLAGGHLGFSKSDLINNTKSLAVLIEETVDAVEPFEKQFAREIPVIAAGGIYTGKDIYDIFKSGAKGVKLGTRFVTTFECDASIEFKESYIHSKKEDIIIINSPVGLPGRAIKNEFIEQVQKGNTKPFKCLWKCLSPCDFKQAPYCIGLALFNAALGNMSEGFAFSGTNAYRATEINHVSEVIDSLMAEYYLEILKEQVLNPILESGLLFKTA